MSATEEVELVSSNPPGRYSEDPRLSMSICGSTVRYVVTIIDTVVNGKTTHKEFDVTAEQYRDIAMTMNLEIRHRIVDMFDNMVSSHVGDLLERLVSE